jgi:hypothetical protein
MVSRRGGGKLRPIFLMLFSALLIVAQWTTVGASASFPELRGEPILEVRGAIENTNANGVARFDLAMLQGLPTTRLETSTAVTDGVHLFEGFLMRDLLAHVRAKGETVTATALNNYVIDFDIDEFERFDVLVAYRMDGEPLLPSDKGPLWIVYPRDQHPELQDIRYDYRWVWQLTRLDIR